MNTQNTSLPFSDVFNIFIGLRAKAVAVSKSDYTMYSMRPKLSSNLRDFWQCIFDVARPSLPQFGDSVRAIALAIIIASHLILICKRNPAETALAGFEHPRSAPQHCFPGAQKQPCGRCCATAVRSIRIFNPYKRDVM